MPMKQMLTFRLAEETYAVDVANAREVLDFTPPTRVPQTPAWMVGVVNLRGSVVPVIDLRLKFGLAAAELTVNSRIIVLEVAIDGEKTILGAVADSVQEVLELDAARIEPPPRLGTRLRTDFIRGMSSHEGKFLVLLDIERVFSADELSLVHVAGEEITAATA